MAPSLRSDRLCFAGRPVEVDDARIAEPGDVLRFSMSTVHGAFDNASPERRCRLSTASGHLLAGEVPDDRWNGEDLQPQGPGRVFYPGLGSWDNADFQDEGEHLDETGRLVMPT